MSYATCCEMAVFRLKKPYPQREGVESGQHHRRGRRPDAFQKQSIISPKSQIGAFTFTLFSLALPESNRENLVCALHTPWKVNETMHLLCRFLQPELWARPGNRFARTSRALNPYFDEAEP